MTRSPPRSQRQVEVAYPHIATSKVEVAYPYISTRKVEAAYPYISTRKMEAVYLYSATQKVEAAYPHSANHKVEAAYPHSANHKVKPGGGAYGLRRASKVSSRETTAFSPGEAASVAPPAPSRFAGEAWSAASGVHSSKVSSRETTAFTPGEAASVAPPAPSRFAGEAWKRVGVCGTYVQAMGASLLGDWRWRRLIHTAQNTRCSRRPRAEKPARWRRLIHTSQHERWRQFIYTAQPKRSRRRRRTDQPARRITRRDLWDRGCCHGGLGRGHLQLHRLPEEEAVLQRGCRRRRGQHGELLHQCSASSSTDSSGEIKTFASQVTRSGIASLHAEPLQRWAGGAEMTHRELSLACPCLRSSLIPHFNARMPYSPLPLSTMSLSTMLGG
ncbi:uncharacterized protein LOC133052993 [Dama dama]|uniref:uncharacterized protein LOC133052993 n=1 Tax=Dama dama TaxID=30532 RepID=UPI002A3718DD|nr:uncharacterized protein LOC133052993 [Dama dama]